MQKIISALLFCGIWSSGYCASTPDLLGLLDDLSANSNTASRVDFVETRSAFFLFDPIISKGVLEFYPPAKMIKHIYYPKKSTLSIENDILSITKKTTKKVDLIEYPLLAIGINAILWVLSGDYAELEEHFEIDFEDKNKHWSIYLTPKNTQILAEITKITIKGADNLISSILLNKSNGDYTLTVLTQNEN